MTVFRKMTSFLMVLVFGLSAVLPSAGAQVFPLTANSVVTAGFRPPVLIGLKIHPENPLLFDFIVDQGQTKLSPEELRSETEKLVKYFFAALAIPDDEVWVNLSPVEKDRIIPDVLGQTVMGKSMLEQDLVLKKLAASLTNPDTELGQQYWTNVRREIRLKLGDADVPVDSFNKVWIVPQSAEVLESQSIVLVGEKRLKVMMADDYEAMKSLGENQPTSDPTKISSVVFKDTVLPEIEREVNEGEKFVAVRQMYNSAILAAWFKKTLKESLLGKIYTDKNKVAGVTTDDKEIKQKVQQQYLETIQKGIYNFIKEDIDEATGETIPRKYFSGGIAQLTPGDNFTVRPVSDGAQADSLVATGVSGNGLVDATVQLAVEPAERAAVTAGVMAIDEFQSQADTIASVNEAIDQLNRIRGQISGLDGPILIPYLDSFKKTLTDTLNLLKVLEPRTAVAVNKFIAVLDADFGAYERSLKDGQAQPGMEDVQQESQSRKVKLLESFDSIKNDFLMPIGGKKNQDLNAQLSRFLNNIAAALPGIERNPQTGEWDFWKYLNEKGADRINFSLYEQEGEIRIEEGFLIFRHMIFEGLDHAGRDRKVIFASTEKMVGHEKTELAYVFDFAQKNGIDSANGLGEAMRAWANDDKQNDEEIIRRQTALRQMIYDAHQQGLVAEGFQKEAETKSIQPYNFVIPYFDVFIAGTGGEGLSENSKEKLDNISRILEKFDANDEFYPKLRLSSKFRWERFQTQRFFSVDRLNTYLGEIINQLSKIFDTYSTQMEDRYRTTITNTVTALKEIQNEQQVSTQRTGDAGGQTASLMMKDKDVSSQLDEIAIVLRSLLSIERSLVRNFRIFKRVFGPESEFFGGDYTRQDADRNISLAMESILELKKQEERLSGLLKKLSDLGADPDKTMLSTSGRIKSVINEIDGFVNGEFMSVSDAEIRTYDLEALIGGLANLLHAFSTTDKLEVNDATAPMTPGGIDFDPTNMNLQIKRDGKGVALPLPQQNLEAIDIEGVFPVIINIVPVTSQNLPILLGLAPKDPAREEEQLARI